MLSRSHANGMIKVLRRRDGLPDAVTWAKPPTESGPTKGFAATPAIKSEKARRRPQPISAAQPGFSQAADDGQNQPFSLPNSLPAPRSVEDVPMFNQKILAVAQVNDEALAPWLDAPELSPTQHRPPQGREDLVENFGAVLLPNGSYRVTIPSSKIRAFLQTL